MLILKVISRLLDYPDVQLQQNITDLKTIIQQAREISPAVRSALVALVEDIYGGDLMDAQETYTGLFDRGRALSLLLFEHVHGESRDRGQAMVDLMALYERRGFAINVRELPDYIPLYLEYLAQRPALEAREGIADVAHILGLLSARLRERRSPYAAAFDALLLIGGASVDLEHLREKVAREERDDTAAALDKVWEEEAISFGAGNTPGDACPSRQPSPAPSAQTAPLHWVDTPRSDVSANPKAAVTATP